jgi:hypothetical protein
MRRVTAPTWPPRCSPVARCAKGAGSEAVTAAVSTAITIAGAALEPSDGVPRDQTRHRPFDL